MTSYLRFEISITIMTSPKSDLEVTLQTVIQQGPHTSTIHFPPCPNLQYFQFANLVIPQMHSSRRDEGIKQKDQADRHSCCTPYVYKRTHLTKWTLTLVMPETGYLVCNTFFCAECVIYHLRLRPSTVIPSTRELSGFLVTFQINKQATQN
jgi:hypothetical protein